ncbi:MAG: DUF5689 domain-containing protein [Arachidicoccus sp.]|nr:DUF5689 domain-containing protein [Arachidicoccus sp.]
MKKTFYSKHIRTLILIINVTIIAFLVSTSCNKKFDTPPLESTDTPTVTMSIKDLKAMHTVKGAYDSIVNDDVISGIVTANDSSGNIYNQIIIQDNTGGLPVQIDEDDLYTLFPVGRKVFIHVKGLTLGDYGGTIQLGKGISTSATTGSKRVGGITSTLVNSFIVKGAGGNIVVPVSISDLSTIDTSMQSPQSSILVTLDSFEFAATDTTATYGYANKDSSSSRWFYLENCAGQQVELYNSSYAYFATLKVPKGKGNITGIYTKYNTTKEILIRDTSDVKFNGPRCGAGGNSGGTSTAIRIVDLRAMYTKDMKLDNYTIGGTVISDAANKNISSGSFVIQSGNSGISVYAGSTVSYNVGDSVVLNLSSSDSLLSYRKSLELKLHYGYTLPTAIQATTAITPATKTIAQINTALGSSLNDANNFEYTLVKISSATASGGTKFSDSNVKLTDSDNNSITLYTSSSATFGSDNLPTVNQGWVGYGYNYNSTHEFSMRNSNDVSAAGSGNNNSSTTGAGIDLGSTSPVTLNFDDIGTSGLPKGVSCYNTATATSAGTTSTFTTTAASWSATGVGFKNFASATGLTSGSAVADQNASTNRAFGVRQTSTAGYDPGAAFVFQISNTTGKTNLKLDFLLQSLDASATGRTATWTVDYAIGDNPTSFTPLTTSPETLTTTLGTFASTAVHVDLPDALNNISSTVWIRIVALTSTSGSSSRPSTAIDDFKISW